MKLIKNIQFFDIVFVLIAIATFRNSYWSVSYIFDGNQPTDFIGATIWFIWGAFFAIVVDFGMFKLSQKLMTQFNWFVLFAYSFAAFISIYLQVIYASYHTSDFVFSSGVNTGVLGFLTIVVNWRLIVLPVSLPLFSVVYTLAQSQFKSVKVITEQDDVPIIEIDQSRALEIKPPQSFSYRCRICGTTGQYSDEGIFNRMAKSHVTKIHPGLSFEEVIEVI